MGSKTTSQVTNTPNPTASAAYDNVIGQAQSVAATPYQPYTGELTAPLNGGQQRSIGQLEGAYGTAQPFMQGGLGALSNASAGLGNVQNYLQAGSQAAAGASGYMGSAADQYARSSGYTDQAAAALGGIGQYQSAAQGAYGQEQAGLGQVGQYLGDAQGYFGQAASLATPQDFSGADGVSKYMSPYQQAVIDSTMAWAKQNDAQQTASLVGNSIGNGAYGGDRNGIAVATLAGQQNMADQSTVAGLRAAPGATKSGGMAPRGRATRRAGRPLRSYAACRQGSTRWRPRRRFARPKRWPTSSSFTLLKVRRIGRTRRPDPGNSTAGT